MQAAPDAVESVMGGRFVTGRCRRNPEGAAAQLEPGVDFALGTARVVQRDEAHRNQPLVVLAEIRDRAVDRRRATIEEIGVVLALLVHAPELAHRERDKDELTIETQQIKSPGALPGIEGAERLPALDEHQIL